MLNDTSPDVAAKQVDIFRQMSPQQRARRVCELTDRTRRLAKDAIARSHPDLSEQERLLLFIDVHYGTALARHVREYLAGR